MWLCASRQAATLASSSSWPSNCKASSKEAFDQSAVGAGAEAAETDAEAEADTAAGGGAGADVEGDGCDAGGRGEARESCGGADAQHAEVNREFGTKT